mmetsp:Transcript_56605/g.66159  ORF Transcript_56605/g.66159 Transcript_56605/m.66159 type:complete len:387 (-) Transcript_56605:184-1344(-)|eukprot:CAMPEP_0194397886 /NCGR_PEP_ID=MMETSP0174-20130528/125794_1 /TAXON_ID=216777 /ORGANISM="Proboscia alata, Strain PI-D3" /LENGTH=386 /DNA_ID=CAMNT_0039194115 /DNA_START=57 /DNA_END=1217 /DNA_ORIENTATION=-
MASTEWISSKLNDEAKKYANVFCGKGTFIVCNVCCEYDINKKDFGVVKLRRPFWIAYFNEHCTSRRHEKNVELKARFEEEDKKRKCELARMKLTESATLNQTKTPNPDQAESDIEGDVEKEGDIKSEEDLAPNTALWRNADVPPMSIDGTRVDNPEITEKSGTTESSHLVANELVYDTLTCPDDICHGIFASRDLFDLDLQSAFQLMLKYYKRSDKTEIEARLVESRAKYYGLFAMNCNKNNARKIEKGTKQCCESCAKVVNESSKNYVKNQRSRVMKKLRLASDAEKVRDGIIALRSPEGRDVIKKFSRINLTYLNDAGRSLREALRNLEAGLDKPSISSMDDSLLSLETSIKRLRSALLDAELKKEGLLRLRKSSRKSKVTTVL